MFTTIDRDAYHAVRRGGVVEFARSQVHAHGKCSAEVESYWRAVCPSFNDHQIREACCNREWCGVFALWVYHREGLTGVPWKVGRGFAHRLKQVARPEPGDLIIYRSKQHHAIFDHAEGGRWHTVDGNQSPGVELRSRPAGAGVAGVWSIAGWIDTAYRASIAGQ